MPEASDAIPERTAVGADVEDPSAGLAIAIAGGVISRAAPAGFFTIQRSPERIIAVMFMYVKPASPIALSAHTTGAIEDVWINNDTLEPAYRVIGREGEKPRGICGSGLLSLLAEMFVTGVVNKAGNLNIGASPHPAARARTGPNM